MVPGSGLETEGKRGLGGEIKIKIKRGKGGGTRYVLPVFGRDGHG
jgi:hypothetical protein